jgi:hypothetical protein
MNVQQYNEDNVKPHLVFMIDEANKRATYCRLTARVDLNNLAAEDQIRNAPGATVQRRPITDAELQKRKDKVFSQLGYEFDVALPQLLHTAATTTSSSGNGTAATAAAGAASTAADADGNSSSGSSGFGSTKQQQQQQQTAASNSGAAISGSATRAATNSDFDSDDDDL